MNFVRRIGFLLFLVIITLLTLEGAASWLLFASRVVVGSTVVSAERIHTEHDSELGWINLPKMYVANLYGPGISLSTNSLRLRGEEVSRAPSSGVPRTICSGDSFTLGYGVSDSETWCHLLGVDTHHETLNMGQGGYGLDQIYLWYKRDGVALLPKVHIVAITLQDLLRMQYSRFLGYPKPRLALHDEKLTTVGIPLPRPERYIGWQWSLQQAAVDLRLSQIVGEGAKRLSFAPPNYAEVTSETLSVVRALITELKEINEEVGAKTSLVLLPIRDDVSGASTHQLVSVLSDICSTVGIGFLDLIDRMKLSSVSERATFFIPEGVVDYPGAAGHYTAAGNGWVAKQIALSQDTK